jgi:hypothetical protein
MSSSSSSASSASSGHHIDATQLQPHFAEAIKEIPAPGIKDEELSLKQRVQIHQYYNETGGAAGKGASSSSK